MTSFTDAAASPPLAPYRIRYVGEPGYTMPVRRPSRAHALALRVAIAVLFGVALVLAGAMVVRSIAAQNAAAPVGPGVVVPQAKGQDVAGPAGWAPSLVPVRGEFGVAPGNQIPPGVQIPLDQDRGLSGPVEWAPSLIPVR